MRSLAGLALGALVVAGCGAGGGSNGAAPSSSRVADGHYAVGKDLESGVYTAALDCVGTISSKPGYQVGRSNPDDFLGGSLQVGDKQRVALKAGEFFTSEECQNGWQREDGSVPATPDPATRAGACTILLGKEKLAELAVDVLKKSATFEDDGRRLSEVQNKLMAVVYSHTSRLWRPAGKLVDFLDAPDAFFENGKLDPRVGRTVATIREVCRT